MLVKVVEVISNLSKYTGLNGGLDNKDKKYTLRESVLNTEKIIKIETNGLSVKEIKESFPELKEENSISTVTFEEGQHTRDMFVLGNIDILIEKFNCGKMILKG